MKKSTFKKAGAAVLSMSMLLSMGAVSLSVYAAPEVVPERAGQIKVVIDGYKQGEGNSAGPDENAANSSAWKYDYISNLAEVSNITVKMYKVATLGNSGWEWEDNTWFQTGWDTNLGYSFTTNDFDVLLDTDNSGNFTANSEQLKELASYLARNVSGATLIAQDTVTSVNDEIYLPATGASLGLTGNQKGYYLIVTETSDAGILIQPSLISLKNEVNNPKTVSLKGSIIDIHKDIKQVANTDAVATNYASATTRTTVKAVTDATTQVATSSDGNTAIASTGKSAVVALNDTTIYQISAQLPKYDVNVSTDTTQTNHITNFVITDTPDAGIKLVPGSVKVFLSTDDEYTTGTITEGDNVRLTDGIDYDLVTNANGSFTVTITGAQMRATSANSAIKNSEAYKRVVRAAEGTSPEVSMQTMENAYIYVTFETTVDETAFNREYKAVTPSVDATNVDTTTYSASLTEIAKAISDGTYAAEITAEGYTSPTDDTAIETLVSTLISVDKQNAAIAIANAAALAANGNKNVARMDYGNDYATGLGDAHDTDETKVYSVDIDLTKVVEKVNLTEYVTADDHFKGENADDPVVGAIFSLTKKYGTGNGSDVLLGYAITDANGKMKLLKAATDDDKTSASTTKYYFNAANADDADNGTSKTEAVTGDNWYVLDGKDAWNMLTIGNYELKEEYAPTGYYKWENAAAFEVKATKQNNDYVGEFSGSSSSEYFMNAAEKADAGVTSVDFVFDNEARVGGTNTPAGTLSHKVYNTPADVLPATGGMGTVLFTAGGIAIILMAGAMFVVYMKKRSAEEE